MKKVVLLSVALAFYLQANEVKNLNDMTVTAQKTEESAQDVPISMSVFDEVSMEDGQMVDLVDMSYFVPNFFLSDPGDFGGYSPSIRGVYADPTMLYSTVGLYIDGVPITVTTGFQALIENMQRIEVLRGPQGTLYGKNAEAGVINIVTKKPDNNLNGKIALEYGEDNKQMVLGTVNTPIIKDKLYVGITGRYYSKEGNMYNPYLDERANDRENYYGKIYLRATPTDRLELALIASRLKVDNGSSSINSDAVNSDPRVIPVDTAANYDNVNDLYAFKFDYNFDAFKLSSTTSYTYYNMKSYTDGDYTSMRLMDWDSDMDFETLSEEFKLDGEYKNLKWLFGLTGSRFKRSGGYTIYSDNPNYNGVASKNKIISKNYGVFMHLNYAFNDKLNILGGIRYDKDISSMDDPSYMFHDEKSSSDISPKIALEYKWTTDFMTYATVAKGYKGGGYYMYADPNYPRGYDSESLWNYETGFKSTLLDGKLSLNANIFYMDISDKQVMSPVSARTNYISNAASATSYGLEFDANYAINDNFSVFGSFGYNEAKFDKFSDVFGTYDDNYVPYAPKYNYALGATFRGFGGIYASANVRGYGKMYFDNANSSESDSYALVDAKIGYEWENFDIYVYATNLFDKNYDQIGGYGGTYSIVNPDREVGLRLTYRF